MAFLDFFTGIDSEDEQARSDKLDAQLRLENDKDRSKRGEDWFEQVSDNVDRGEINVSKAIQDVFFGNEDADPSDDPAPQSRPAIDPIVIHICIGVVIWLLTKKSK